MVHAVDDSRPPSMLSARQGGGHGVGRIPPHNLEAEESLLGAMLLSRDAIATAMELCGADDFYKTSHGYIFEAIVGLYSKGESADWVTVTEELRRRNLLEAIGDPAVFVELQANTPSVGNAEYYAKIVEENALLRRLVAVAGEINELGFSVPKDVSEVLDRAEKLVFDVAQRKVTDTSKHLQELLGDSLDHLERLANRQESVTGLATGYTDLDEMLAGLQPSNLIVVGARPAMGKTAFALGMVANAGVKLKKPVLLFSLEMSHLELTQRMLSSEARVDAGRMRTGKLRENDWPKIGEAISRMSEAPIYIDDNPQLTIMDIRARARRLKSRVGLSLVVIDYLQLMTGRSNAENRQVEVSEMSRNLKILARELEVPVVALSQLSRTLESRTDKRPMLSDLRESGSIEQDADVVLFLYRDEVYNPDVPESQGTAEVIVAKHRNGPTGTSRLAFIGNHARFDNMARV